MYTSTKVNHLSSDVLLGDLNIFLQEHEQREEESVAETQGKKWIVWEEKQQQVRETSSFTPNELPLQYEVLCSSLNFDFWSPGEGR